jgi:predicted negative regulator of RcsB-dependent stress response
MVRLLRCLAVLILSVVASPPVVRAHAANLSLPDNLQSILDQIYSGHHDQALQEIHELQSQSPNDPLGYLLEAEAEWWPIWCVSAEFKYGMTMARHHDKGSADQHYLDLATKAYSLAEASLHQKDSAEMHLYAAMADALASRLYSLRGEYRATARAGVRARENFQKAIAMDPSLSDAYTGLGLYNYYVDTLSTLARLLRFVMGIPGGSKEEGIQQLERAIREGTITPSVARFYLALNLENYDQQYGQALEVIRPLVEKYPDNAIFQLVEGDLYAKLGRKAQAEASYRAAINAAAQETNPHCRGNLSRLGQESLAAIGSH